MSYDFSRDQVLQAIDGSYGIMSNVARRLGGCAWHTAERYVNRWVSTQQAFANAKEVALDFSEGKMLEAIRNGDGPMIRFHLSTIGKKRGFVTQTEIAGPDGGRIEIEYVNDWRNKASDATSGAEGDSE